MIYYVLDLVSGIRLDNLTDEICSANRIALSHLKTVNTTSMRS